MKKLLILMTAFTLSSGVFAQDKMDSKMSNDNKMDKMHGKMRDGVMMKDGKMMVMKDGKTMMMKDGDCVYMNGKMSKMKMDKMKNK